MNILNNYFVIGEDEKAVFSIASDKVTVGGSEERSCTEMGKGAGGKGW